MILSLIDNTTKIIKGLMEEDERIILLKNKINRGTLYTKSLGVINAKGKYVMTLDHDNFYANEKVFDKLYNEAEKYNIDLLGFAAINSGISFTNLRKNDYINYFRTSIIKQPYTKNRFLGSNKEQSKPYLCLYFIKANIYKNVIKKLGDEFIKRNIDSHDDTIIMLLLSRNVLSLKHLKAIYYILLKWPKEYSSSLNFQIIVKNRERQRKISYSYLTFSKVLLLFTENNEYDKNIAENNFLYWFIQEKQCRNITEIINDTQRICRLYLDNKSISNNAKKEISYYLYELQKNK